MVQGIFKNNFAQQRITFSAQHAYKNPFIYKVRIISHTVKYFSHSKIFKLSMKMASDRQSYTVIGKINLSSFQKWYWFGSTN